MGKRKRGEKRRDKFYRRSKKMGYRSRAALILVEIDSMFNFLHNARSVLDLGAAPGGWLQVVVSRAPVSSFILGVDLAPIRPIEGAHTIAADITKPGCRAAIKSLMDSNNVSIFDVVLHDGSPNVGSAWGMFPTMQSAMVLDAMRLTTNFLAPEGIFLTKAFRSKDYFDLVYCLKQFFEKVDVTKPEASRSTSSEIYIIGQGYKAPSRIDPRLLDAKHLFQASAEPKVGKVSDFIWSDSPVEFLGSVNALSFEDLSSLSVKEHNLTTNEIKSLCEDLYILDKNSFEHLLRWRMQIRKALEGNEDKRLLAEMEELAHAMERKKKKAKKLLKQSCSLAAIKGKQVLQTSESTCDEDSELGGGESDAETDAPGDSSSDVDSDEDQRRYNEILEEIHERYLNWKAGSTKQHKDAKQGLRIEDAELMENADNEDIAMDTEFDQDQDDQLQVVKIHAQRAKKAAKAKAWNKRAARRKMEKGC